MSLHIGNISSRVRRDELEHVFRKFGPCNVRMKGAYGFVVYEFPPNAKVALRALHKTNICGEQLTLSWSNKQPRPTKRFARTARSYEPKPGRDSDRGGDYAIRKYGSNDRQDYWAKINQTDSNGGRLGSVDMHVEETANHQVDIIDHVSKENQVYRDDFQDEDCRVEPELVENDRWGDQFRDPPNEAAVEIGVGFDRYDPYQGHDKKHDDENLLEAYSGGSPALRISQENVRRDNIGKITSSRPNDAKFQETCYKCGRSGHKRRNCPLKNASQRKFTRFDHRHSDDRHRNGRGRRELERFGSRSWEKHEPSRDLLSGRRTENEKNSSGFGRRQRSTRSGRSAMVKENDGFWNEEYKRKKRSRKEIESPKRQRTKKARRSSSFPLHSDYTASRVHLMSRSTKDLQRSHSCSGSKSVSSSSRSVPASRHSRSKSSKSRSRSSSPTSLSLSVSLDRPLLSLSTKVQMNAKGSLDNATTPESKEVLIEEIQLVEGNACLEGAKLEKEMVVVNNGNAVSSSNASDEMEKDQHLHNNNDSFQVVSDLLHKATDPSVLLSDKGTPATGSLSPECLLEMEHQNSDSFMMEHLPIPTKKPDSEAPAVPSSVHSTSISAEELCMVLNHYGIDCQGENERHLPAEAYFGSARLWPWEIIYYRRLKKGLISIENHARRVDQNREFGIADKYIRSSSGWGELNQENP